MSARPIARLVLSATGIGVAWPNPSAKALRFANRLEAWQWRLRSAGLGLPLALPPSAVPWHAALVRFWASPNVLGATAGFRDQQVPSRANGSFGPSEKDRPGVLVNLRRPGGVITCMCSPRAGDKGTQGKLRWNGRRRFSGRPRHRIPSRWASVRNWKPLSVPKDRDSL
jgi:hypothetical protein